MSKFLNFEEDEKGYEAIGKGRDSIKENIGKSIVYVESRDYDRHRGTYKVRYGIIHKIRYSLIFLDEHDSRTLDIRDILEIGVKIEST